MQDPKYIPLDLEGQLIASFVKLSSFQKGLIVGIAFILAGLILIRAIKFSNLGVKDDYLDESKKDNKDGHPLE